jgi:1,4-alpha-glucan branching enzyme
LTKAPSTTASSPTGFLTLTLHAHLPYVVNHGTWPHGMEWLHEAAAETYLPLLRVLKNLERDNVRFNCNLNLSPILLEQLCHPTFIAEFPKYLTRKIVAAGEDEAFFIQSGEAHFAETARFWQSFFSQALEDFHAFNGDLIGAFRHFNDIGLIDIITSSATHSYLPLLGTDESVRAQIRTAHATHIRHFGKAPKGIWSTECGYRPAGLWNYPVANADGTAPAPGFHRIGVEQAFTESNLDFFIVDTPLVEQGQRVASASDSPVDSLDEFAFRDPNRTLYQPYYINSPDNGSGNDHLPSTVFPRDPRTALQVWSGEIGYPGDSSYLDFHKKRWPGGHRYWRITGPHVGMNDKQPYYPQDAASQVKSHAAHFVHTVYEALRPCFNEAVPPVLTAPFDAELFGHWWFEGPIWLEAVARTLHDYDTGIQLISSAEYLERFPPANSITMHEGSWGTEGTHQAWMNPDTSWTYTHIYPAELYTREICTNGPWRGSQLGTRILQQLCRELMLLESSDWQFLITTGAARDYAEIRFLTHNDQFNEIKSIWQTFAFTNTITEAQQTRLAEIEQRDLIFPDIDPSLWSAGSKQTPQESPVHTHEEATA